MENTTGLVFESALVSEKTKNITAVTIFLIIAVLVLVSNVFVLLVLHKGRSQFDEVMLILLQILALSDLLGGTIASLLTSSVQLLDANPVSRVICRATPMVTTFMVLQSLYIVGLVNFFRYLSVTHPLLYLRVMTVARVRVAAVIIKTCVLLNTLILLPVQGFPFKDIFDDMCGEDQLDILQHRPSKDVLLSDAKAGLIYTSVSFLIPLCLLTFVNVRLFCIACGVRHRLNDQIKALQWNNSKITATGPSSSVQLKEDRRRMCRRYHRKGLKGFMTVFVLTGSFYLSCLPFVILSTLSVVTQDMGRFFYEYGWMLALILFISNSWWNAPIYLLTCKTFRKKAFEMLACTKLRRIPSLQENEHTNNVTYLFKLRHHTSNPSENNRSDHVVSE